MNTLNFTSYQGIPMVARIVRIGDRYGLEGCLTHEGPTEKNPWTLSEEMVEFFDARFDHNEWIGFVGQFVSRYYTSTFMDVLGGLCLDGGNRVWNLDAEDVGKVQAWVSNEILGEKE